MCLNISWGGNLPSSIIHKAKFDVQPCLGRWFANAPSNDQTTKQARFLVILSNSTWLCGSHVHCQKMSEASRRPLGPDDANVCHESVKDFVVLYSGRSGTLQDMLISILGKTNMHSFAPWRQASPCFPLWLPCRQMGDESSEALQDSAMRLESRGCRKIHWTKYLKTAIKQ